MSAGKRRVAAEDMDMAGNMSWTVATASVAVLLACTGPLGARDAKGKTNPGWCGEFIGPTDRLAVTGCGGNGSVTFSFRSRNEPEVTRDCVVGLEKNNARHGCANGLGFAVSTDGRAITVTGRKGDGKRYAGTYLRLEQVTMRGDALVTADSNKVLVKSRGDLQAVANADLRFAAIGSYQVEENSLPVRPGLYLVNTNNEVRYLDRRVAASTADDGKALLLGPEEFGEAGLASLSPGGDILAVNLSYEPSGRWFFFSWPDLQPLAHPVISSFIVGDTPSLLWSGSRQVVVDAMLEEHTKRTCEYDPCGPVSVVAFDIDSGLTTVLKQGTDLCEYRALALEGDKVTIGETCKATPADWRTYPDKPEKTITVALPERSR